MTLATLFFGTWISGWGRAVSWGHYAMVANCAVLTYAGLRLGVEWALIGVLVLGPLVFLSFIDRNRPWFLRSPDGIILDKVQR